MPFKGHACNMLDGWGNKKRIRGACWSQKQLKNALFKLAQLSDWVILFFTGCSCQDP